MKLVRLLRQFLEIGSRESRALLEAESVMVNGKIERNPSRAIGFFDQVECKGQTIQARSRHNLMLNKPAGHVSATVDSEHPTVLDLIDEPWKNELHLAGRLDRFTTGLVILTNDSSYSEALTEPGRQVPKGYKVETDCPIPEEAIQAIRTGMPFEKEGIITHPALMELEGERTCDLTIYEGKHHQVKRMFARFRIKVVALHRYRNRQGAAGCEPATRRLPGVDRSGVEPSLVGRSEHDGAVSDPCVTPPQPGSP